MAYHNMKIKVRVVDLLERVEQKRASAIAAHTAAVKKWERQQAGWDQKIIDSLTAALDNATSGGKSAEVDTFYRDGRYQRFILVPTKAGELTEPTLTTARFDKDIAILKMATEDVLAISADDNFGRYL